MLYNFTSIPAAENHFEASFGRKAAPRPMWNMIGQSPHCGCGCENEDRLCSVLQKKPGKQPHVFSEMAANMAMHQYILYYIGIAGCCISRTRSTTFSISVGIKQLMHFSTSSSRVVGSTETCRANVGVTWDNFNTKTSQHLGVWLAARIRLKGSRGVELLSLLKWASFTGIFIS